MTIIMSPKQLKAEAQELAARFAGKTCELNGQKAQIFRVALKGKRSMYAEIREVGGKTKRTVKGREVSNVMQEQAGAF